jgi:hypothetical protein
MHTSGVEFGQFFRLTTDANGETTFQRIPRTTAAPPQIGYTTLEQGQVKGRWRPLGEVRPA